MKSQTLRLAATYLVIIMTLSIGFSFALYGTSSHELNRQIPPDSFFANGNGYGGQRPPVNDFLQRRAQEGRDALVTRLVILNALALVAGGGISYLLARRSLRPIEAAMEAQSRFVSDASHELRTPLTAMQTSNEVFLRKQTATIAQARTLIQQNNKDIDGLKTLSDALLKLARQEDVHHKLKPIGLQSVLSDALTTVVGQATEKDVSVDDTVDDLQVQGDGPSLTQLLTILLSNAVKYSHTGGTVYITSERKGKYVEVVVRDEGVGIRASDIPHLFRRFYRADNARTDSSRDGYGLGLAIAEQIATQHGGTITVQSELGKGSSFRLSLLAAS